MELNEIIGVKPATKKPWTVQRPEYKELDGQEMFAHYLRALHLKRNKLNSFKCVCVLDTGEELLGPGIDTVKIYNTKFGHAHKIDIRFTPIDLRIPLTVVSLKLIDDLGFEVLQKNPSMTQWVPSDTFITSMQVFLQ
jgi:hypothetical protein